MKSLPGSIFRSWKLVSGINIRIPHGNVSQRHLPCWRRKWEERVGGWLSSKENVLRRVTERVNLGTKTFYLTYNSQDCHNIWCPSWAVSYGSRKKKKNAGVRQCDSAFAVSQQSQKQHLDSLLHQANKSEPKLLLQAVHFSLLQLGAADKSDASAFLCRV